MSSAPRREPGRSRAEDLSVVGLIVFATLGTREWLEHGIPALSELCKLAAVAVAAALLGGGLLRWRDARRRELAGETAEQTRSILDSGAAVQEVCQGRPEQGQAEFLAKRETELREFSERREKELSDFETNQQRELAKIKMQLQEISESYDAPGRPAKKGALFGWG